MTCETQSVANQMGETCVTHWRVKNEYKFFSKIMKGRDHLKDLVSQVIS